MPALPATILRYLRRLVEPADGDAALLGRFLASRDERALAGLVERHGPMVFRVCQRVLANRQDAEDAFQATFLVLARKASSVQPRFALAAWLYGVARKVALKARATQSRRPLAARPTTAPADPRPDPAT